MYRAIIKANVMANKPSIRKDLSKLLSPANYLNQPELVLRQSIMGRFADGVDTIQDVPDRMGFDVMPWHSVAAWMMTQMKRWGLYNRQHQLSRYRKSGIYAHGCQKQMQAMGYTVKDDEPKITVMGKQFNATDPDAYLDSFAIGHKSTGRLHGT